MHGPTLLAGAILAMFTGSASAETLVVGHFSERSLQNWQSRTFQGQTDYRLVTDPDRQVVVLEATAEATASGRYREVRVDLSKTPFLNWSWKVTGIFDGIDESQRSGDDFPARLYVVAQRGLFGLSSISLNYVWASGKGIGSIWASPYTDQVRLMAVDSGQAGLGQWVDHKRNLRADLRRVFGEDVATIDVVALMTDADDHGATAHSFYGDIWFSAE